MTKGKSNKRCTSMETMHKEKLSYQEATRQFDISGQDRVASWVRIYPEEGKEGLYMERRGRK